MSRWRAKSPGLPRRLPSAMFAATEELDRRSCEMRPISRRRGRSRSARTRAARICRADSRQSAVDSRSLDAPQTPSAGSCCRLSAVNCRLDLDALAAVDDTTPCSELFDAVARPVVDDHRRFRALRIGDADDLALLHAISRGEFATAGLRNREVRHLLHPASSTAPAPDQHRLAAKISRKLRILRAHGLIKKVPRTHRYQLTERGRLLTAALRATRDANIQKLLRQAA